MSLMEDYVLQTSKLLVFVGFELIFKLSSPQNEKVQLNQLHNER